MVPPGLSRGAQGAAVRKRTLGPRALPGSGVAALLGTATPGDRCLLRPNGVSERLTNTTTAAEGCRSLGLERGGKRPTHSKRHPITPESVARDGPIHAGARDGSVEHYRPPATGPWAIGSRAGGHGAKGVPVQSALAAGRLAGVPDRHRVIRRDNELNRPVYRRRTPRR